MASTRRPRRGVVLLLVLSLLVLFVLLGMTFLIGATRYRHGAESFSQNDLHGDPPDKIADIAMMSLLREPQSPYSSLAGHSLLQDLYGNSDGVAGLGTAVAVATAPDLVQITIVNSQTDIAVGNLSTLNDYYGGCVITVSFGSAPPLSSRVVRYDAPNTPNGPSVFYTERFDVNVTGVVQFRVNGKPYNGPGVGYDFMTGFPNRGYFLDSNDPSQDGDTSDPGDDFGVPFALLPHYAKYGAIGGIAFGGDADESYDALDYQNVFLARNPSNNPPGAGPHTPLPRVASFHRPELINYWRAFWQDKENNGAVNRWKGGSIANSNYPNYTKTRGAVVFRPMPWDHPNFTGSNPQLEALPVNLWWSLGPDNQAGRAGVDDDNNGVVDDLSELGAYGSDDHIRHTLTGSETKSPDAVLLSRLMDAGVQDLEGDGVEGAYDVDNDGDGLLDSYWLDLQLPIKTAANGRAYKPLLAFLVVDMDGRLNINAHGNLAQIQEDYRIGENPSADGRRPYAGGTTTNGAIWNFEDPDGDGIPDRRLARGSGYGPAEINFRHLVDNPNLGWPARNDADTYQKYLAARYASNDPLDFMPGSASFPNEEPLNIFKSVGRPTVYASTNTGNQGSWQYPSAFLTPPDIFGRGTVGIDYSGRPIWLFQGKADMFTDVSGGTNLGMVNERTNHPYEINLVSPDGKDQAFTPNELERLLRWRDSDAGVHPRRLLDPDEDGVLDLPSSLADLSKLLTTHSFYVPAQPPAVVPRDTGAPNEVYDILFPDPSDPMTNNAARIAPRDATTLAANWRMPTLMDLMAAKIVQGHRAASSDNNPANIPNNVNGIPSANLNPLGPQRLQSELDHLLALELRHGLKFDPNRLWGDGSDDDGDGAVDEPGEEPGDDIWRDTNRTPVSYNVDPTTGYANDSTLATPQPNPWSQATHPRSRGVYARHLYMLMMLMVDLDYVPSSSASPQVPGFAEPYIDSSLQANFSMRRELTIRRNAQWAVNVVDFRDADGIMTPFEYDVNPWNGWNVDGDITTLDEVTPGTPHPDRRVIFGCEFPDAVITETVAIHDRRVKDTDVEIESGDDTDPVDSPQKREGNSMMMEQDATLDQYRLPQGSLFVELYCPRRNTWTNAAGQDDLIVAPRELYTLRTAGTPQQGDDSIRLDLGRLAPGDPTVAGGNSTDDWRANPQPVWRLAISVPHHSASGNETLSPRNRSYVQSDGVTPISSGTFAPDNTSFQPREATANSPLPPWEEMTLTPNSGEELPIDRVVWFANANPAPFGPGDPRNHPDADRIFYKRFGQSELPAGDYLVVGPRVKTHIGSLDMQWDPQTGIVDEPSTQFIEMQLANDPLIPAQVGRVNYADQGYPTLGTQIRTPWMMIAASNPPTNWSQDPADLQETADVGMDLAGVSPIPGIGLNVSEPLRNNYYPEPTDYVVNDPRFPVKDTWRADPADPASFNLPDIPFDSDDNLAPPLSDANGMTRATRTTLNYRTVFLQRLANPQAPYHPYYNPYITIDWSPVDLSIFNGESRAGAAPNGEDWDPDDPNPNPEDPTTPRSPGPNEEWRFGSRERSDWSQYNLWKTNSMDPNEADGNKPPPPPGTNYDFFDLYLRHSLGYLNRWFDGNPAATPVNMFTLPPAHPTVVGDPLNAFPWLTWNNRPYVSHLELMMVPSSSPGRLLHEFQWRGPNDAAGDPYVPFNVTTPPSALNTAPYSSYRSPFGHLLNFFNTSNTPSSGSTNVGANYYRILDYIEVPSRFVGAEKWYNPAQLSAAITPGFPAATYRPPFNFMSRFREPGRVNLNTLWDAPTNTNPPIWRGLSEGYPSAISLWANIYASKSTPLSPLPLPSPTAYPNPVRPAGAAGLAPIPELEVPGSFATLLRHDPLAGPSPFRPLLDAPDNQYPPNANDATRVATNPLTNPYFRYQGLQRLGNLVSAQSNVFAVWMTIGYFEVEPNPGGIDEMHPDGVRLGQELNAETGDVQRHRAFYIIDRSIPVAFQPGTNHNVENTILLRRFIE